MNIHVVLVEPEIPQNTGNIARTCAAIGADLHLIEPLGFSIDEKQVRRAGLDYWDLVGVHSWKSWDEFAREHQHVKEGFYFATTKAPQDYSTVKFPDPVYFVFGKETKGLPEDLLQFNKQQCIRIPMKDDARSLNLSNSVAILVYEALRQHNFSGLNSKGHLRSGAW